jgi:predicted amidophosphoribosyltransferase
MALRVDEASEAYERSMRNMAPAGPGVCRVCRAFIDPEYETCFACGHQPQNVDVVVPITYSEHLGQMHTALRNYKDGATPEIRGYAAVRLAAILWRFLRQHERCVSVAAGAEAFDLVTVVPSSNPDRDEHSPFRLITEAVEPIRDRLRRTLRPIGEVVGRDYDPRRFEAIDTVSGSAVLLLDDTWVTGGHAQSAASALRAAGAAKVAVVVIGRHLRREYEPVAGSGTDCGDLFDALPPAFSWTTCAVHDQASVALEP